MFQRPLVACAAIDQYWPRFCGPDLCQCMHLLLVRVVSKCTIVCEETVLRKVSDALIGDNANVAGWLLSFQSTYRMVRYVLRMVVYGLRLMPSTEG